MNTLQELTDKLYTEGVEKGKAEAAALLAKAQEEAAAIVAEAEREAKATLAVAEQQAAELDKNTRAELKLYAEQSVNAIKTEITNLITGSIASDSVKAATADKAFMQKLITNLAAQLAKGGEVIIEAKQAAELKKYVEANVKGLLDKGVKIEEVKGLKTDFAIKPAKDGYKLAFGDNEFIEYFKEYLRPQIQEMLF